MKANPWIQKIAGLAAAWLVAIAAQYLGITLSETEVAGLIVTVLTLVEFWIAKHTNPGNAASAHLAAREKLEAATLKTNDDAANR